MNRVMTYWVGLFLILIPCIWEGMTMSALCQIDSVEVKVMTYNIRIGVGGEKEHLPAIEGLEKVAKVIELFDPDILLVQEIEQEATRSQFINQIHWLQTRLDYPHAAFGPARSIADWHYGVAIFSRYPTQFSSQRYLLYQPDYRESHPEYPDYYMEQRALLRASTQIEGIPVNIFCTHLGLTAHQRLRQVQDILDVAQEFDPPIILGGDFNAAPDSEEMQLLKKHYVAVFDTLSIPLVRRFSFPAGKNPDRAIDTILVSPDIEVLEAHVILDETLASDHNPVFSRIRIPLAP